MKSTIMLTLLHILLQLKDTLAVGTSEGREFIIATPPSTSAYDPVSDYPRLVLILGSLNLVRVRVNTECTVPQQTKVNETVDLYPFTTQRFTKKNVYFGPNQTLGVGWSYHLTGIETFVVLVVMETSATSIETFTALPVDAWGRKYTTVNLSKHFSIVIIASYFGNKLTVTLRTVLPSNTSLTIGNVSLSTDKQWTLELTDYQSYALSNCGQTDAPVKTLVFELESDYLFGLVAGYCEGMTYNTTCGSPPALKKGQRQTRNVIGEMLLPFESAGRFYILFDETGSNYSSGFYLQTPMPSVEEARKQLREKQVPKNETKLFQTNTASFQVLYMQDSNCLPDVRSGTGDVSLLQLIPVELFYNIYICIFPDKDMKHELVLVAESTYLGTIKYASTSAEKVIERLLFFQSYNHSFTDNDQVWGVYRFAVRRNATLTVYSPLARYGCYVVGSGESGAYMHSAGFISSNINPATCVNQPDSMKPGDLLDNDCDGFVDEDLRKQSSSENLTWDYWPHNGSKLTLCNPIIYCPNNLFYHSFDFPGVEPETPEETTQASWSNNETTQTVEGDTAASNYSILPDEDETNYTDDPTMTPWTKWSCTRNCSDRNKIRTRHCLPQAIPVPCLGSLVQVKAAQCYVKICPDDCFGKVYGEDCQYECNQCTLKCDPFNGTCTECYYGFDYPETACQSDHRNYEDWTKWHCSEDCSNSRFIRNRFCRVKDINSNYAPCTKPVVDSKPGDCFIGKICPKSCSDYKWDVNCVGSCVNCAKPCHKFTGVCEACRPGYRNPQRGCVEACGANQYGVDCVGDCFEKCGEDCADRATGECLAKSSVSFYLFYLFLLLIPLSIFLYFISSRRKAYKMAVMETLVTSKSVISGLSRSKSRQSMRSSRSSRPSSSKSAADPSVPLTLSRSRSQTNVIPMDRKATSDTIY